MRIAAMIEGGRHAHSQQAVGHPRPRQGHRKCLEIRMSSGAPAHAARFVSSTSLCAWPEALSSLRQVPGLWPVRARYVYRNVDDAECRESG